ncbi:hypothetical protein BGZ95_007984 [Linnemannia exigua]|uniref:Uncharacterized protein n=1 Tax=Linnemannia exigua TaxID=604196 RepID=A0AAD4DGA7_9FUNG|nr:hypothetical protein BGZ95_007984 [Linnemannia exigua]
MDDDNDDHQQQGLLDQPQDQQQEQEQQELEQQVHEHQEHEQQQQQRQQRRSKIDGRKRPLLPLPSIYKIQLHLRKGEPLERRRLTSGLPDPEPYDHIQGQDSFVILMKRIAARVARFPELFWPEDGSPYIKPAESVPQKYYQMLTPDNYEAHMAKAWRMEAKRLQDQSLIVLNLFVYLKDRDVPQDVAVAAEAVPAPMRGGKKPAVAVTGAAPLLVPAALPSPGAAVARAPGRPPHSKTPPGHVSPYRPMRHPSPHLHGARRPPPPGHGPPIRRPMPGVRPPGPPGMDSRRVRGSPADQAIRSRVLTPDEAVVAAINSSVVSGAHLTSPVEGSSNSSSSISTTTGATSITPILSPTLDTTTPPSPTATRTQAPRAASASARHRLSAIPNTHLPPPPLHPALATSSASAVPPIIDQDQDHDMHDDNDNDNQFDDLMQDDFDHGMQDPTTPPPTNSSSSASVSPSSSSMPSIHTYSTQSQPLGSPHSSHAHLSPSDTQQQQQQQQPAQATAADEGDFRTVYFKMGGVVVPMLVDVKSLRAAIFS